MHAPSEQHDQLVDNEIDDLTDRVEELEFQQSQQTSRPPSAPQSPVRSQPSSQSPRNGHHSPSTPIQNGHQQFYHSSRNPKMPVSKMHTGQKNISSNVFAAVSPGQKMEFDQVDDPGFGSVKINRPIRNPHDKHETDSVISHDSQNSRFTDQGHFDLKYHHNRLW